MTRLYYNMACEQEYILYRAGRATRVVLLSAPTSGNGTRWAVVRIVEGPDFGRKIAVNAAALREDCFELAR